jgi:hypothetical protein
MKLLALLLLVLPLQSVWATENYCEKLNVTAKDVNWHRVYIGVVVGNKRLYFHSAPDSKCKENRRFVIPGDNVSIYSSYGKFSQISFSNRSDNYVVWVLTRGLKVIAKPDEPFVP